MPATAMDELQSALSAVAGARPANLGSRQGASWAARSSSPCCACHGALGNHAGWTVFQNLERFYTMVLRGMRFEYEELGPRQGLGSARADARTSRRRSSTSRAGTSPTCSSSAAVQGTSRTGETSAATPS